MGGQHRSGSLDPPHGLRASALSIAGEEIVVLSFPIAPRRIAVRLTPAQQAVLDGILDGLSNDEIARARGTSRRTIANQIASIFRAFGVHSRLELVHKVTADDAETDDSR